MSGTVTFHNDKKLKAKYVKRVLCHQMADKLIELLKLEKTSNDL